ncbi:MAG TPA: hydrolase, partial [Spirochaetia bacterium]|nr:hydrolase [Spirochaetia bacterium]
MMAIEAVFFDAAGTLFEVRGSVGQIYSMIAQRYGIHTNPDALNQAFARAFRTKSSQPLTFDIQDTVAEEKRWWREIVEEVFSGRMAEDDFQAYFDEVFEFFRSTGAWQLYP